MWQLQVAPLCWLLCHINIVHNQPPTHTSGEVAAESDKQQLWSRAVQCSAVWHTQLGLPAARTEVATAVRRSSWWHQVLKHETGLCIIEPCSLVGWYQCLWGTWCMYLQGWSEQGRVPIWFLSRVQGRWLIRWKDEKKKKKTGFWHWNSESMFCCSRTAQCHSKRPQYQFVQQENLNRTMLVRWFKPYTLPVLCCNQPQWLQCNTWSVQKVMKLLVWTKVIGKIFKFRCNPFKTSTLPEVLQCSLEVADCPKMMSLNQSRTSQ